MDATLSVIVPAWNAAPYLDVLLRSLLAQTIDDLEIVVVDDGSSDATAAIAEALAAADPRLRLIRQANAGVSAARNRGLDAARGRWIAFADADDWLAPDTCARWLAQAQDQDLELLIGASFRFESAVPSAPSFQEGPRAPVVEGRAAIRDAVRTRSWRHFVHLQLIRRDLLDRLQLRFVEGIVHEDVLWTAALMLGAVRVGHCGAPLYGYRVTPGSLSSTHTPAIVRHRALSYFTVIDGLLKMARALSPDEATAAALRRQAACEARHLYTVIARNTARGSRYALAADFVRRGYPWLIADDGPGGALRRSWRALRIRAVLGLIAGRRPPEG
ncbi:MAG: glycosyltransferase [Nevskia sp.]